MNQRESRPVLPARIDEVVLRYSSCEAWDDGDSELEIWQVSADVMDWETDQVASHVGDFEFIVADPFKTRGLWMALDGYTADMTEMAAALLDPGRNDLREDLYERAQGAGVGMLILAQARLADEWRGFGVGTALVGKAIRRLGDGCRGAACYPMPLPRRGIELSEEEIAIGVAALTKTWERLGFEPYRNGVMVLDLGLRMAEERLYERIAAAERLDQPER